MRGAFLSVTGISIAISLLAGCGTAGLPPAGPSSIPPPASPTATPPPFTGDLKALLLPPPATSHPFAHPVSKDGTLNADQIAGLFGDPEEVKAQLAGGFVAGVIEEWHDADDTQVIIQLYEFLNADNARSWFRFNHAGFEARPGINDQSPIEGIDGSGSYVSTHPNSDGFYVTSGLAWTDNIFMHIQVFQPVRAIRSLAEKIMRDQYARLP